MPNSRDSRDIYDCSVEKCAGGAGRPGERSVRLRGRRRMRNLLKRWRMCWRGSRLSLAFGGMSALLRVLLRLVGVIHCGFRCCSWICSGGEHVVVDAVVDGKESEVSWTLISWVMMEGTRVRRSWSGREASFICWLVG